jgi:hypothetical protein
MDTIGDSTLTTLQLPASITASGSSASIDALALSGLGCILLTSRNSAGTLPTLAMKLQGSPERNVVTSVTPGSNTGNGHCTEVAGGPDCVAETYTITFTSATAFGVTGSVSGALAAGVVGTRYSKATIGFLITAGSTAWINGDTLVIIVTARVYADVSGGAFTGLTTVSTVQKRNLNFDQLPRFLRMNYTIGGTVSPAYTVAAFALSATH